MGRDGILCIAALAFLLSSAATCAAGGPEAPGLIGKAAGKSLRIMFTSDTRGLLRRCGCSEGQQGGLSARASFIKANRIDGGTIVVDAGDNFFGDAKLDFRKRAFYELKTRTIASAMGIAGYDASAVGEYDLALGLDNVTGAADVSGIPFVSANLKRDSLLCWDRRPFERSVIIEAGGFRVGIIGVIDSGFSYASFGEGYKDVIVSDTVEAVSTEAARIEGDTDLIVVLAHLSFMEPEDLAERVGLADIIIRGHGAGRLGEPVLVGGTLIMEGYDRAKHIGVLDVKVDTDGRVSGFEFEEAPLDESVPFDPEVEDLLAGYRAELKRRSFDYAVPDPEDAAGYVGPDVCADCHAEAYGNWAATTHSWALDTLGKKGDDFDPECLPCHTTGYGYESGYRTGGENARLAHVTCEACHGRGSGHVGIRRGADTGFEDNMSRIVPEETCLGCHDETNSSGFIYEYYLNKGGNHSGGPVIN